MNFLEEKIITDGIIKAGNLLKVDNFLNHQIDIDIIRQIAYELKRRFRGETINKILTIEASGIAIATMLATSMMCPWCLPRKVRLQTQPTTSTWPKPIRSPINATIKSSYRVLT